MFHITLGHHHWDTANVLQDSYLKCENVSEEHWNQFHIVRDNKPVNTEHPLCLQSEYTVYVLYALTSAVVHTVISCHIYSSIFALQSSCLYHLEACMYTNVYICIHVFYNLVFAILLSIVSCKYCMIFFCNEQIIAIECAFDIHIGRAGMLCCYSSPEQANLLDIALLESWPDTIKPTNYNITWHITNFSAVLAFGQNSMKGENWLGRCYYNTGKLWFDSMKAKRCPCHMAVTMPLGFSATQLWLIQNNYSKSLARHWYLLHKQGRDLSDQWASLIVF